MKRFFAFIDSKGIGISIPAIERSSIEMIVEEAFAEASYDNDEERRMLADMIGNGIDMLRGR